MDLKADLHIHTKESDGCLTIEEVLRTASQQNIKTLAITDHETTSGVEKAKKAAFAYGISVIPGVELSTIYQEEEIHLLGYYKNINSDYLQEKLQQLRNDRTKITKNMVQKLKQQGLTIEWEKVQETASKEGVVCKTHIMYAIRNNAPGLNQINWNTVASWFRPGGLGYIPYEGNPFKEAVDFIYSTGGLPVLAHPGLIRNKSMIKDLLSYRPIGLEVYYGYWDQTKDIVSYFEVLSENEAILSTGGSDYHGFYSPVGIGQIAVPDKCVEDLKHYLHMK